MKVKRRALCLERNLNALGEFEGAYPFIAVFERIGMQKPQLKQYEKKHLATAMVLFEYCAAFKILMREKTAQRIENFRLGVVFWLQ